MKPVDKKYALNNSYFKNKKEEYPDTLLDIVKYHEQFHELPFEYSGENWIYDTMLERQKRSGVKYCQYLTPDKIARQIVELTNNFIPENNKVLNACCGIGQIARYLLQNGLDVRGFDIDSDMVEICKILYPNGEFFQYKIDKDGNDLIREDQLNRLDLIVSNPPFQLNDLTVFLDWLSWALSFEGKAILMLPKDTFSKTDSKQLSPLIKRFRVLHQEAIEGDMYIKCEIYIVELSEMYKSLFTGSEQNNKSNTESSMETIKQDSIQMIPLDKITINPCNPRKKIDQEEIVELSQSIKNVGLLQAITLRQIDDKYQIVCGERRYRAFLLNIETYIPATIRQYTDDQVMEIALAENLNRKDLSAIEEANGFQYFLNTNRYKLEDLVSIFGKSEAYIRGRLRLLNLIDEYQELLDNDTMTISMGLELAKYSKAIQKEVYEDHFVKDDSSNWKDLGTKDFAGRLQRMYTMDLSNYSFDKTECKSCPHNTDSYSLFIQADGGKCTNAECLKKKRTKYTLDCCKALTESEVNITVCISPLDKPNEEISSNLQHEGIDIKTVITQEYPELPPKPEQESYPTDAAYKEAMEEYKIEEMAFHAELDEIERKVEAGQYKKYIYIGDNNPKFCYANVEQDKTIDPVKELEEQDSKNKELAIRNICKEALELLSTKELPVTDFSLFEDELFLYFMLNYLKPKHYHLFGISNQNTLSERDKEGIIKSITQQQRTLLVREVITSHFMNIRDYSSKHKSSFLLTEFVKRLLPQEMNVIITKYMDTYQKASERIKVKINKMTEVKSLI